MTPIRMKSCRLMLVAMNSMAQQASPKLNTHSEYRRPQFSTNRMGSPSTPGRPATPSTYLPRRGPEAPWSGGTDPEGVHRRSVTPTLRRMETRAGVAASHPATADVGVQILRAGGTAADAAVAAVLTCCVAETIYTGLGGGGFATYFDASTGAVTCLDF